RLRHSDTPVRTGTGTRRFQLARFRTRTSPDRLHRRVGADVPDRRNRHADARPVQRRTRPEQGRETRSSFPAECPPVPTCGPAGRHRLRRSS
nr:hypothetical protein [Tanacetum cinerariifolium]